MANRSLAFEIGNGTDVGRVRSANEDSFSCFEPANRKQMSAKGYLLAICDGMGGAVGGKTASEMALNTISEIYYSQKDRDPSGALSDAIVEANRRIFDRAQTETGLKGMGTTAVIAVLLGGELHLAHVGDSRCYLVREGEIRQLTEDHSLVHQMVRDGLITPEEARNHPEGHILNRSIGVSPEVEADLLQPPLPLRPGDRIILCSDGLTGQVSDDEIQAAIESAPPQVAVEKLIALANERGGPDNITVQIARAGSGAPKRRADGVTMQRAALRPRKRVRVRWWLLSLLMLTLAAAGVFFLWLFEIADFRELLNQKWLPRPPEHFWPFK